MSLLWHGIDASKDPPETAILTEWEVRKLYPGAGLASVDTGYVRLAATRERALELGWEDVAALWGGTNRTIEVSTKGGSR